MALPLTGTRSEKLLNYSIWLLQLFMTVRIQKFKTRKDTVPSKGIDKKHCNTSIRSMSDEDKVIEHFESSGRCGCH